MKAFKPSKNRSSLISNEVMMKHRYDLSLNAQKVLFGLAQSIDHTGDLFGAIEIDIQAFFQYLGIESRNDRYQLVRDSFLEITKNPLQYSTEDAKRWAFIPWMSVKFDGEDSNSVVIRFTEDAKPFLLQLNGYVKIQGKYITSLQSHHATWLYPVMKMIQGKYYGQHVLSVERLMEYTFTDDKKKNPAYHNPKSGKSDFMKRVLGLKKEGKIYVVIDDSPLGQINRHTDIIVSAEPLRTGRSIDRIAFIVSAKKESPKNVGFSTKNYDVIKSDKLPFSMNIKEVYATAKAMEITVAQLCKEAGYVIKDNKVYKANDKWLQEQKQNTLFDKALE